MPDESHSENDADRSVDQHEDSTANDDRARDRPSPVDDEVIGEAVFGRPDGETLSEPAISTDRLFELLASPGNRFVLTYLLRAGTAVAYADVVEYVVTRADPPGGMTEAKFRGRVAATLINERLPELREAGLVEVDSTHQRVSPTPATEVVAPYLALALSDLTNAHPPE
jgi:hypothetical protein